MLASHCACRARPLVDADSRAGTALEWKFHGFGAPTGIADRAIDILANLATRFRRGDGSTQSILTQSAMHSCMQSR